MAAGVKINIPHLRGSAHGSAPSSPVPQRYNPDDLNTILQNIRGAIDSINQLLSAYDIGIVTQLQLLRPDGSVAGWLGFDDSVSVTKTGLKADYVSVETNVNDAGFLLQGADTGISPVIKFADAGGTIRARIGIAGAAGELTAGSAADDLVLRGQSTAILFTTDGGSSLTLKLKDNRVFVAVPNSAPTDSDIPNSFMSPWYDEGANLLTFRIRKSDGTLVTKTL